MGTTKRVGSFVLAALLLTVIGMARVPAQISPTGVKNDSGSSLVTPTAVGNHAAPRAYP
jgi:hypothetical protein